MMQRLKRSVYDRVGSRACSSANILRASPPEAHAVSPPPTHSMHKVALTALYFLKGDAAPQVKFLPPPLNKYIDCQSMPSQFSQAK